MRINASRVLRAIGVILWLTVPAACTSTRPLGLDGSSTGPGTGGGSSMPPAGNGGSSSTSSGLGGSGWSSTPTLLADAGSGADCGSPMELAPCRSDSDCGSAYLVCVPPDYVTITFCRDPDASVDPSCPSFPEFSTAPTCPNVVDVTSPVCEVRYQRPCTTDADCGPTGFTCMDRRCQQQTRITCTTSSDCPTEWECYAPCACPGVDAMKTCEPPFAVFRCPNCAPVQQ